MRSTVCAVSAVATGVGLGLRARARASGGFDRGSAHSSHTGASAASFKKVQCSQAHASPITVRLVGVREGQLLATDVVQTRMG